MKQSSLLHANEWRRFVRAGTVAGLLVMGCGGDANPSVTELRIWQTETDPDAVRVLDSLAKIFESRHPGVSVRIESVAWGSLSPKLTIAMEAGNEPDAAHIEPFMAYSLIERGKLIPITELVREIEAQNGKVIYPGVRNLQKFHDQVYGIAYAVGTTGYSFRKDIAKELGLNVPETWDEFLSFARKIDAKKGLKVILPGGDPFFIDQLFAELVANNGGQLFDSKDGHPLLESKPVVEVLEFFKKLRPHVDPSWISQTYLDQFSRMGRGEASVVMVTYARAAKGIKKAVIGMGDRTKLSATTDVFALMPQPRGPSLVGRSVATIDCEPYVIFRKAEERKFKKTSNAELAAEFLKLFFTEANYVKFCSKVPIHLTPIFKGSETNPVYAQSDFIKDWKQWNDQTMLFLNENRVRPILMPGDSSEGQRFPFLLQFQTSRILTRAVVDVIHDRVEPKVAARRAQDRAEQLIMDLRRQY